MDNEYLNEEVEEIEMEMAQIRELIEVTEVADNRKMLMEELQNLIYARAAKL